MRLLPRQAEKTLTRNISHFVIENNKEIYVEGLSKTGGDFRKLAFSYDTHYESVDGVIQNIQQLQQPLYRFDEEYRSNL